MNPKNSLEIIALGGASARPCTRLGTEPVSEPRYGPPRLFDSAFAGLGAALLLLLAIPALAATPTTEIKVDQVGYLSGAPKVALVASKTAAKEFTVRSAAGAIAFRAALAPPVDDADSGDRVQAADFTALSTPG